MHDEIGIVDSRGVDAGFVLTRKQKRAKILYARTPPPTVGGHAALACVEARNLSVHSRAAVLCHGVVTAAEPDWLTKLTPDVAAY